MARTTAPVGEPRITRQLRIDPDTWTAFAGHVGEKNASPTLRRLVGLYLADERLRKRTAKAEDPSPDRRYTAGQK